MSALAPVMEGFFTERLIAQRRASPHTVASYRDTFRLLLGFAQHHTGKTPVKCDLGWSQVGHGCRSTTRYQWG